MRPAPVAIWTFAIIVLMTSLARAATVVGDANDPAALFQQIVDAYRANAQRPEVPNVVTVRPGTYVIPAKPGTDKSTTWAFTQANALVNCTIDLTGVTLVFEGIDGTNLEFQSCRDATFKGATVYKPIPSFTQGTIVAKGRIDPERWYEDVQVDAGYVSDVKDIKDKPTVHLFDPKVTDAAGRPLWKANIGYNHAGQVDALGKAGLIRLTYIGKREIESYSAVGDRVVLRGKGVFSTIVRDSANVTFADLTLGNNGLYGIVEFTCQGIRYVRTRITYGPPPPGATVAPIVASSADGLHSLYGNPGPTIEACTIEGTPDDAIAIHGAYGTIGKVLAGNVLELVPKDFRGVQTFYAGDAIRLQGDQTGFYADAKVQSVQKVGDAWQLTLDRPLDLRPGYRVANPKRCGQGYRVVGTTIRRNRARGMLLKADGGLVENNLVEDSSIAGIVVTPETGSDEAGYAHDVVIRGNTVRHTGYSENGPWSAQASGISVLGNGSIGNRNIAIENNLLDRVIGVNMIIIGADGVRVAGNRFLNTHTESVQNGTHFGNNPAATINVRLSRNVTIVDNVTDGLGTHGKALVDVDEKTVQNLTGRDSGITIDPRAAETTSDPDAGATRDAASSAIVVPGTGRYRAVTRHTPVERLRAR